MSGRRRPGEDDLANLGKLRLRAALAEVSEELAEARELGDEGSSPRPALLRAREKLHALLTSLGVKLVVLVLLFASSVACEPCWSAPVHVDRCEHGDDASCAWLLEHVDATTGACEVRR